MPASPGGGDIPPPLGCHARTAVRWSVIMQRVSQLARGKLSKVCLCDRLQLVRSVMADYSFASTEADWLDEMHVSHAGVG
eukprot:146364-Rhodomonas_salina.2